MDVRTRGALWDARPLDGMVDVLQEGGIMAQWGIRARHCSGFAWGSRPLSVRCNIVSSRALIAMVRATMKAM